MSDVDNTQRKYSIAEIDAMRAAIGALIQYRTMGSSYRASERAAEIEDQLRTHMLNGTDLGEIQKAAQAARKAHFEHDEAMQAHYREVQAQHAEKFPERPRPDGIMECLSVKDQRANAFNHGGSRCGNCRQTQPADAFIVWVPDNTRMGERAESIARAANSFNGGSTGWCVDCARKLTRKAG